MRAFLVCVLLLCSIILCSNMLFGLEHAKGNKASDFVWPGHGIASDMPIWGMRDGLRISIEKTKGPKGLIRIYTTFLNFKSDRTVNFISIEPSVVGEEGRGQSELEMSRFRPNEQGLSFFASNSKNKFKTDHKPVSGVLGNDGNTLRVYIHTEKFKNGAAPVVEVIFNRHYPKTLELRTYAGPQSAKMAYCTLSATMGNFALLRRLHLKPGVAWAERMWKDEEPKGMGFYTWRSWPADKCMQLADGRPIVYASSNFSETKGIPYHPKLRKQHWFYTGDLCGQFWCGEADADITAWVNARSTYWKSKLPIPGGASFENFEMRAPFKPGQRFWFGIIKAGETIDVKKLPVPASK